MAGDCPGDSVTGWSRLVVGWKFHLQGHRGQLVSLLRELDDKALKLVRWGSKVGFRGAEQLRNFSERIS